MAERRTIRGVAGRAACALAVALLLGAGGAAARTPHPTRTADDIPLPPAPPATMPPATMPPSTPPALPTPPVPAAPPEGACTKDEVGAKAARLMGLLEGLIQRDPERARLLVDELQATVQRTEQHQLDLGGECSAYDALIARATG